MLSSSELPSSTGTSRVLRSKKASTLCKPLYESATAKIETDSSFKTLLTQLRLLILISQTLHHGAKKKSSTLRPRKSSRATVEPESKGSWNDGAGVCTGTKLRSCHAVTTTKIVKISSPFISHRFQFIQYFIFLQILFLQFYP